MPDHYTYPGTDVLINRYGHQDFDVWKSAERRFVSVRMAELALHPLPGNFDLPHLQAIHARLVEGFYDWGGRLRDTDTGPGGTGIAHCRPEFIPAEAARVFTALAEAGHLMRQDRDGFSRGLAHAWGEITAVHPFRDVNTRSQFVFFNQLATEAGWVIDWATVDPYLFAHARTVAIYRDEAGLDALLYPALIPAGEAGGGEPRTGSRQGSRPKPRHEGEELERRLREAIGQRRTRGDANPQPPDTATR